MDRRQLAEKYTSQLGFRPTECVRWLAPAELIRTAVKVGLAGAFAAYADKREIQASFADGPEIDLSDRTDLWFDFVADLGDGFDATYTVASVVARPSVSVDVPGGTTKAELPAGELLVFGGDEVYPASSVYGYENRTTGPYRSALPAVKGTPERLVVALPGNHDWYDGLTSFLRTFTQGRSYGGWRTVQNRSYFTVKLPHGWWLVGLDTQLAANVDEPQLRYLLKHITSQLQDGDGIIVCTASPTWMHTVTKHDADAFNTLHFVERSYLRRKPATAEDGGAPVPTGAAVRLWLTGDSHHYARFAEAPADGPEPPDAQGEMGGPAPAVGRKDEQSPADPRATQFITCGLGGAYLGGTHDVPAELTLPPPGSTMRDKDEVGRRFVLSGPTYPSRSDSRRQAWFLALPGRRNLLLRNPGFGVFMTGVHLVLFTLFSQLFGLVKGLPAVTARRSGDVPGAATLALVVLVVTLLVSVGLATWRAWQRIPGWPEDPSGRPTHVRLLRVAWSAAALWGLQIALAGGVFVFAVTDPWPTGEPWLDLLLVAVVAAVAGGLLGTEAFALYIRSADGGQVADWQMSGQAIEDHKGFLRIRVTETGVEVYPLVIDRICRDWEVEPSGDGGVRPVPAGEAPTVRLLEGPVLISRDGYPR